jgi:hypothetical protein
MALDKTTLGALIKSKMLAADPSISKPAMVESFANAIADAIVTHITSAGTVTILPASIVTTGGPTTQSGPAAPIVLSIV